MSKMTAPRHTRAGERSAAGDRVLILRRTAAEAELTPCALLSGAGHTARRASRGGVQVLTCFGSFEGTIFDKLARQAQLVLIDFACRSSVYALALLLPGELQFGIHRRILDAAAFLEIASDVMTRRGLPGFTRIGPATLRLAQRRRLAAGQGDVRWRGDVPLERRSWYTAPRCVGRSTKFSCRRRRGRCTGGPRHLFPGGRIIAGSRYNSAATRKPITDVVNGIGSVFFALASVSEVGRRTISPPAAPIAVIGNDGSGDPNCGQPPGRGPPGAIGFRVRPGTLKLT